MRHLFVLLLAVSAFITDAASQGCVAIRSTGSSCTIEKPENQSKWQVNANYRYFKSFRHFKGKEEQKERVELQTDVRNYSHSLDLSVVRKLNTRWSLGLNLPLLFNMRSSLYEHGRKERRFTSSSGLGDMRLSAYYWMLDPAKS